MRMLKILVALIAIPSLAGCEVIGAIFGAGMWLGIILVLAALGLIGLVASRFKN